MRHLGEHVGSFWLAEKAGGAGFTADDEELLVLFAAQAAVAIANAIRDERRARADLEALVDTSGRRGGVRRGDRDPVSLNREARRIVERLRQPGRITEDLLDVVTCRRADGSERSTSAPTTTWSTSLGDRADGAGARRAAAAAGGAGSRSASWPSTTAAAAPRSPAAS